ncbi:MAG: tetratricopeptide repeat protein, partial [Bryobacteraceae bacterium]
EQRSTMPKKPASKPLAKKSKVRTTPAAMEAMMWQFAQVLEGADSSEGVTKDDIDALVASLQGPLPTEGLSDKEANAKDEAQQIAFDAMEAGSESEARKLAKRALRLDPDCVDALVVITDLDAHTTRETIEGLQKAVAAGERSLGEKFIRENKGRFWLLLDTRPYMRALQSLAEAYRSQGIALDAIRLYERMLELNPNDNQGVRKPLLGLYLETGDLKSAQRLLKQFHEDGSASFEWARVVERFMAGDRNGASKALKAARKANLHVELLLTQKKALPLEMPEMYSMGSEEEAVLVLSYLSGALAEQKEASLWIFEQFAAAGAHPDARGTRLRRMPVTGKTVH